MKRWRPARGTVQGTVAAHCYRDHWEPGRRPEERFTTDGKQQVSIRVAANSRRKGPDGEQRERTDWVRARIGGGRADYVARELRSGCGRQIDAAHRARRLRGLPARRSRRRNPNGHETLGWPEPAPIRGRVFSAWSRTWSG
ncbi:MAG: single-stranded DNA-binding protein, partial [Chloroflexi bacterium]|nr:single-stranded DNA-binding protein [Chloroflexota bacterium]